jgi:5'(3')-deoxyribonucleotidase
MKKKLFLDLDGTIAKFNSKRNALARFDNEVGFFLSLKPFAHLDSIDAMIQQNKIEIFVISASPNEQADKDKMQWLKNNLPSLKESNICFCRLGQNKAQEIKRQLNITIDSSCYLLDDYTKNLTEWNNCNGIGIKRLTSLADNSTKQWKGLAIKDLRQLATLLD